MQILEVAYAAYNRPRTYVVPRAAITRHYLVELRNVNKSDTDTLYRYVRNLLGLERDFTLVTYTGGTMLFYYQGKDPGELADFVDRTWTVFDDYPFRPVCVGQIANPADTIRVAYAN